MPDNFNKKSCSISITKVILAVAFVVTFIAVYILFALQTPPKHLAGQGGLTHEQGTAQIGGEFELTDQNGERFSSNKLLGKMSLVYFGFTYCPDICPTSLSKLAKVMKTLRQYHIDCNVVFITIDPERDTTAVLKEYLTHFDPSFIGLTGTADEIKKAADNYKVYFARAKDSTAGGQYLLDHSSFVYLMDSNGKYVKHFYLNTEPEEIIDFIRVNK